MTQQSVTVINDAELIRLITGVQRRLVLLAPGLSTAVAKAVADVARRLPPDPQGKVTVILDTEDEVFLTGLGELEAVQIVRDALHARGDALASQPGVRIGVLLADNTTLIWSPTPLLIASGPKPAEDPRQLRPNAIRLESPPPAVAGALGAGESGLRDRSVGLDAIDSSQLNQVRERLKVNPPQKFDVAQRVRMFNAFFQFVELEMTGVELHRKMVPLPSDLFGLADTDTQRQLRASFRIVPESDRGLGNDLVDRKKALVGKYLRLIPGHGWVVLRCERPQLDKAVEKLKADVEAFGKMLEGNLQKRMNLQRNQLFEALWPSVRTNPPQRYLDAWWVRSAEERLRHSLKRDLTKAFGSAASLIHAMAVKHQYKDVTYESLQDKQFMAKVRQAVPELTQHHEEGDAALSLQQGADLLPSAA